jgi:hypothetical protein
VKWLARGIGIQALRFAADFGRSGGGAMVGYPAGKIQWWPFKRESRGKPGDRLAFLKKGNL